MGVSDFGSGMASDGVVGVLLTGLGATFRALPRGAAGELVGIDVALAAAATTGDGGGGEGDGDGETKRAEVDGRGTITASAEAPSVAALVCHPG